jgi:hypothetical protein
MSPSSPRLWTSLALLGSAAGLTVTPATADTLLVASSPDRIWLAQAEGGEGGEAGAVAAAPADAGYVASLGFVQGHLRVGLALYQEGQADMAISHMKHPQDEIYADLAPQLAAHGAAGFADELTALATAVEAGAPVAEAEAAFAAITAEIKEARETVAPRQQLDAMAIMVRTAADEFALGVVDGKVAELHEYQDAWGFVQTAREWSVDLMLSTDPAVSAAAGKVLEALSQAEAAFDTLAPEGAVTGTPDILYGAAAQIEFAALAVN